MNRVPFFDAQVRESFWRLAGQFSLLLSFLFIVVELPPEWKNLWVVLGIVAGLALLYVAIWWQAQRTSQVSLTINDTQVHVKVGDIFAEPGLKVIACNEYFDTIVDNRLVTATSLNGVFLRERVPDVAVLDAAIASDAHLATRRLPSVPRPYGKAQRYELGSLMEYDGFLLLAFARYDEEQRGFLSIKDYTACMLTFWSEVELLYAGRPIVVPLMGAGITRFLGYSTITPQELLELMLVTLKLSRLTLKSDCAVTFIVHDTTRPRINFHKLTTIV
jgi:hypothetical protein